MDVSNVINIGKLIHEKVKEQNVDDSRIIHFFRCQYHDINEMYNLKSMDTDLILKWSKLLEYDFFRVFSQHQLVYTPVLRSETIKSSLPIFRKRAYTREGINFFLELIENGVKSKSQIIKEYNIPKCTLYTWASKYKRDIKNNK